VLVVYVDSLNCTSSYSTAGAHTGSMAQAGGIAVHLPAPNSSIHMQTMHSAQSAANTLHAPMPAINMLHATAGVSSQVPTSVLHSQASLGGPFHMEALVGPQGVQSHGVHQSMWPPGSGAHSLPDVSVLFSCVILCSGISVDER